MFKLIILVHLLVSILGEGVNTDIKEQGVNTEDGDQEVNTDNEDQEVNTENDHQEVKTEIVEGGKNTEGSGDEGVNIEIEAQEVNTDIEDQEENTVGGYQGVNKEIEDQGVNTEIENQGMNTEGGDQGLDLEGGDQGTNIEAGDHIVNKNIEDQEKKHIYCFQCNSATDRDGCEKKRVAGDNAFILPLYFEECADPKARICRKISQEVRGVKTVIRSCGYELWKDEEETCYKTLHQEFNTLVCSCTGDGCNGASSFGLSITLVGVTVIAAVIASSLSKLQC